MEDKKANNSANKTTLADKCFECIEKSCVWCKESEFFRRGNVCHCGHFNGFFKSCRDYTLGGTNYNDAKACSGLPGAKDKENNKDSTDETSKSEPGAKENNEDPTVQTSNSVTDQCIDCVEKDCVWCQESDFHRKGNVCHCKAFDGFFQSCSDYTFAGDKYETINDCKLGTEYGDIIVTFVVVLVIMCFVCFSARCIKSIRKKRNQGIIHGRTSHMEQIQNTQRSISVQSVPTRKAQPTQPSKPVESLNYPKATNLDPPVAMAVLATGNVSSRTLATLPIAPSAPSAVPQYIPDKNISY